MKPTLSLYFFRRIISTVSLLWLALWALLLFFDLLRNADNDGFLNTFIMALLQSPQSAMETLPFACAIGSTLAIRRMVRDGEMAALRTAGLSPVVIVTLQLIAALPFLAAYILFSEILLPGGANLAQAIENKSNTVHGLWLAEGDDYIHIQKLENNNVMLSVAIYHTENATLKGITRAARADFKNDSWRLHDVVHLGNDNGALSEQRQQQQAWALSLRPSSFSAVSANPREMAVYDAMRAAADLAAAGQHNSTLQKVIWRRWLTLPAILLLVVFAVGFISAGRRGRYAVSLPVLAAAAVTGIYFIARDIAIQTAEISDTPLLLLLPPLAFIAYLIYSVRRAAVV